MQQQGLPEIASIASCASWSRWGIWRGNLIGDIATPPIRVEAWSGGRVAGITKTVSR